MATINNTIVKALGITLLSIIAAELITIVILALTGHLHSAAGN